MIITFDYVTGEYCRMVDRDGKQVLMCTWGKKDTSTVELDFAPFFDDSKPEANNQVTVLAHLSVRIDIGGIVDHHCLSFLCRPQ